MITEMVRGVILLLIGSLFLQGCDDAKVTPQDIYPEDMCALCRMAFSDQRFASEIVSGTGEVFKFDDIGCMEEFTTVRSVIPIAGTFYKDFQTKRWIAAEEARVVVTSVSTPMASGKVAFADTAAASEFLRQYPPPSP